MSRPKRKSKQKTRDPRPGYARVLQLKHIRPGRVACFLFFEGSIALAFLLGFAELISVWTALAIPVLVAVMVKMNDIIAGAVAAPADDATEDPLARQWETDVAEVEPDEYECDEDDYDQFEPERDDDPGVAEPAVARAPRSAAAQAEAGALPDEYDDDVDSDGRPGVYEEREPGGPHEGGPDEVGSDDDGDESEAEPDDDVDTDARHEGALREPEERALAEAETAAREVGTAAPEAETAAPEATMAEAAPAPTVADAAAAEDRGDTEVTKGSAEGEDADRTPGNAGSDAVDGAAAEHGVRSGQPAAVDAPEEPVATDAPREPPATADPSEADGDARSSEVEHSLREHARKRR